MRRSLAPWHNPFYMLHVRHSSPTLLTFIPLHLVLSVNLYAQVLIEICRLAVSKFGL